MKETFVHSYDHLFSNGCNTVSNMVITSRCRSQIPLVNPRSELFFIRGNLQPPSIHPIYCSVSYHTSRIPMQEYNLASTVDIKASLAVSPTFGIFMAILLLRRRSHLRLRSRRRTNPRLPTTQPIRRRRLTRRPSRRLLRRYSTSCSRFLRRSSTSCSRLRRRTCRWFLRSGRCPSSRLLSTHARHRCGTPRRCWR